VKNYSSTNKEGRPNEIFLMTPNTFKQLCVLANTEKGKQVRLYYIKMESVMMKYLKEKNKFNEQLLIKCKQEKNEAEQKAKNMEYAYLTEQEKIARITNRRVQKEKSGQIVYIYKETEFKYKIGESSNIARRENAHGCSNTQNSIVYTKRCCNCKLLEKVVHYILDQYRDINNREWFTVSFEIAKTALDSAHIFLDGLINRCNSICTKSFFHKLKDLVQDLPEISDGKTHNIEKNNQIVEIIQNPEKPIEINLDNIVNPLDFNKFIEECCEKDEKYTAFSAELFGCHRNWSRCSKKTTKDAFYKFLCDNFKKCKIFDDKSKARLASYRGLRIKNSMMPRKPKDIQEDIEQFISTKCEASYTGRIASKDIYEAFESYKQESDSMYKLNSYEKVRIDHYFKYAFLPSLVFTGTMSKHGYFFVTLKDKPNTTGLKLANKLKKKIIKIDITTKEIIETFDSLTAAAKSIGRTPACVSTDIIYQRPRDNFLFQYID
jgi:hypothetical protein